MIPIVILQLIEGGVYVDSFLNKVILAPSLHGHICCQFIHLLKKKCTSPEWPTIMLGEGATILESSALAGGGTYVSGCVFFCFAVTHILLLPTGVGYQAAWDPSSS
jgi:hypothetical protein